jgi:hypothetical protein
LIDPEGFIATAKMALLLEEAARATAARNVKLDARDHEGLLLTGLVNFRSWARF